MTCESCNALRAQVAALQAENERLTRERDESSCALTEWWDHDNKRIVELETELAAAQAKLAVPGPEDVQKLVARLRNAPNEAFEAFEAWRLSDERQDAHDPSDADAEIQAAFYAGIKHAHAALALRLQAAQQREAECRKALTELVMLKDLKIRAGAMNSYARGAPGKVRAGMLREYELRKGPAWEAARAALATQPTSKEET